MKAFLAETHPVSFCNTVAVLSYFIYFITVLLIIHNLIFFWSFLSRTWRCGIFISFRSRGVTSRSPCRNCHPDCYSNISAGAFRSSKDSFRICRRFWPPALPRPSPSAAWAQHHNCGDIQRVSLSPPTPARVHSSPIIEQPALRPREGSQAAVQRRLSSVPWR